MKINIKNFCESLYIFIITFASFPPMIISLWPKLQNLDILIKILQVLVGVIGLFWVFFPKIKIKYIKLYSPIIIMFLWINFSNIINNGIIDINFFGITLRTCGYIFIIQKYKNDLDRVLKVTSIYCVFITTINLISQIIYQDGIYRGEWSMSWQPYYICGNANSFVFFYLFSECIVLLYSYRKEKKVTPVVLIYELTLIVSLAKEQSSTGLILMLVGFLITLFSNKIIIDLVKKYYKVITAIIVTVVLWIIVFGGWNNKDLLVIINKISSDGINSFLERGTIWSNSINLIKKSPLIGQGTKVLKMVNGFKNVKKSAHNTFLQLTLYGGIPVFFSYLIVIFNTLKIIRFNKDKDIYFIIMFFCLYLIAFLFEQNPFYIGFYALVTFANILVEKKNIVNRNGNLEKNLCQEQKS